MNPNLEYISWGEALVLGTIVSSFIIMELLFIGSLRKRDKKDGNDDEL